MEISIKRIYNQQNQETGAILYAIVDRATTNQEKINIENRLSLYAFDVLYPGIPLNKYSEVFSDTPSIVVIKNINDLPAEIVTIK